MMNAFHSLHFQVIKCAATFALLGHYKNRNAIMKHATRNVTIGDDINLTRILTWQDHV